MADSYEKQIQLVIAVAKQHEPETKVTWYGAYAIVGCTSLSLAWTVRAQLKRVGDWTYDIKPGRKYKHYHYLKVTFN